MKKLSLHSDLSNEYIEIPVDVIDRYMPQATAAALKVYLYLLRASRDHSILLSVNDMADLFDVTPNKILQALSWWEGQGLLSLKFSDGELQDITLLPIARPDSSPVQAAVPEPERPSILRQPAPSGVSESARPAVPGNVRALIRGALRESVPAGKAAAPGPMDLSVLMDDSGFGDILSLAEFYIKKPLSASMRDALGYCYLSFGRQGDIIEYLLEYCIERGHTSPHYLKGVAEGWKKDGLNTLDEIRSEKALRAKSVYGIMNAFGLDRKPVQDELRFIEQWNDSFSSDMILEACRRTMAALAKPSFPYADSILNRWKESGAVTLSDVEALDLKHQESRKKAAAQEGKPPKNSSFKNFEERDTDYAKLFPKFYQKQS